VSRKFCPFQQAIFFKSVQTIEFFSQKLFDINNTKGSQDSQEASNTKTAMNQNGAPIGFASKNNLGKNHCKCVFF
jgi:hypothetical protein